jgi:Zn-dependent protease
MTLQHVDVLFELIVLLFAISIHESAHAWMANKRGDPTANMLGRITLNPIKHIDPIGTILLPAICILTGAPLFGWAKPTPVNPQNFKNPVMDDILTSVAGPLSNLIVALGALVILVLVSVSSPTGREVVHGTPFGMGALGGPTILVPVARLLYIAIVINLILMVFNLIPVPPLDGSHVFRHLLSGSALALYDRIGIVGLVVLVAFGGRFLSGLVSPVLMVFRSILMNL